MPRLGYAYADTVRVRVSTLERTRERFVIGGLDFALKDEPHPPKLRRKEKA
ncbi:hypothetical protein [Nostoc sp. NZL]|uniref:hypothetical protein n=1 Tax=Nostoc sp. NZL TaxID=2650612 RepID=UPI0018C60FED|nr:hypothetical protein [Nostoc sp. NZL]